MLLKQVPLNGCIMNKSAFELTLALVKLTKRQLNIL